MSDVQRMERSKAVARVVLGVFHMACLAVIAVIPAFTSCHESISTWAMALIIANAVVAVAVTGPLGERETSHKWRTLWPLWLLAAYMVGSSLAFRFDLQRWSIEPITSVGALPIRLSSWDILYALGCLLVMSVLARFQLSQKAPSHSWRIWTTLVAMIVAARWNHELAWVPSYGLVFMGSYIAYGTLGRRWLLRSAIVATCVAAIPCVEVIFSFLAQCSNHPIGNGFWSALFYLREYSGTFGLNDPAGTASLLLWMPATAVATACASRGFRRLPMLLVSVLAVLAVIATGRRAALYTLVVLPLVAAVVSRRLRPRLFVMIFASAIGLVGLLKAAGIISSSIFRFMTFNRGHLWNNLAAIDMFSKRPIFGAGFSLYHSYAVMFGAAHGVDLGWSTSAHNDYLQVLAGYGIVGFILFVAAGYQLLAVSIRLANREKKGPARLLMLAFCSQTITLGITYCVLMGGVFLMPAWTIPVGMLLSAALGAVWTDPPSDPDLSATA